MIAYFNQVEKQFRCQIAKKTALLDIGYGAINFLRFINYRSNIFRCFVRLLLGGLGGGGSELMDGRGCAIFAAQLAPKNLIFHIKILPKNLFYKILCLPFQQGKLERTTSFVSHK